jgi:hypothetical protein
MIIVGTPSIIVLAVTREAFVATIQSFVKGRRVGKGAKRRAHHSFERCGEMVGFAHPTKNYTSRDCAIAA